MMRAAIILAAGLAAGAAGGFLYARLPGDTRAAVSASAQTAAPAAARKIVYYRDPSGAPYWSAQPKKDSQGRDYLPVHEDEDISFNPRPDTTQAASAAPSAERKIKY